MGPAAEPRVPLERVQAVGTLAVSPHVVSGFALPAAGVVGKDVVDAIRLVGGDGPAGGGRGGSGNRGKEKDKLGRMMMAERSGDRTKALDMGMCSVLVENGTGWKARGVSLWQPLDAIDLEPYNATAQI